MKRRKLKTLAWADIGKRIDFISTREQWVDGTLRSFTHGVFSHPSAGEYDVPRVLVSVYAGRSHESHWADPEASARIHALAEVGLDRPAEHREAP